MNNFARDFTYEAPNPSHDLGKASINIAFVGNPNCGKTTLFNAFTGAKLKTANWPGVTVEAKTGETTFQGHVAELLDLPGIYSLTSYTQEEKIARNHILSGGSDVIVHVIDATSLERSLYLTIQLLELKQPVVVALNMMDLAKKYGLEIDLHRLSEVLGCPVIPVSARKREGLSSLMHACLHHKGYAGDGFKHFHETDDGMREKHDQNVIVYAKEHEIEIDRLEKEIASYYPTVENTRWHAIKLLEGDADIAKALSNVSLPKESKEDVLISERYDFISRIMKECVFQDAAKKKRTDKLDNVLTNPLAAIPLFLCIMAAVFLVTFGVGDVLKNLLETGLEAFTELVSNWLLALGAAPPLISLICSGIITGVGTILTFLPNIFILFCALGFLEDCGYMSRVAYIMDSIMAKLGLSGRAFIPMILGFGCTVPAIMGTRTLENDHDRKKVMLVLPFMSCSARLPIYILFAGMFFPGASALVAFSLYALGIAVALVVLKVLETLHANKPSPLLIELPDYKLPSFHTMYIYVSEKIKDYVLRAGTVIFVASVCLWLLMSFGPSGFVGDAVAGSFAALIGHVMAPLLAPLGFGDWRLAVALLAGISAKEVVVSSVSVLFGTDAAVGNGALAGHLAAIGFGSASALSFMVFCLLYVPCIATIAVLQSESKSAGFAAKAVVLQVGVAWVLSFAVYHLALLFGLT